MTIPMTILTRKLEDILSQFGEDIEGPLTELRDLLVKEFGNLGEELDKLGSAAAKELDSEPDAGQDILRELGHWLINLADEKADDKEEDVVVMEFKPKEDQADNPSDTTDDISIDDQEEDSESASEEILEQGLTQEQDEENVSTVVDRETESDTSELVAESDTPLPSSTALKDDKSTVDKSWRQFWDETQYERHQKHTLRAA